MYYVKGYDFDGSVILLTSKSFSDFVSAYRYATSCHPGYRAFVVRFTD